MKNTLHCKCYQDIAGRMEGIKNPAQICAFSHQIHLVDTVRLESWSSQLFGESISISTKSWVLHPTRQYWLLQYIYWSRSQLCVLVPKNAFYACLLPRAWSPVGGCCSLDFTPKESEGHPVWIEVLILFLRNLKINPSHLPLASSAKLSIRGTVSLLVPKFFDASVICAYLQLLSER